MVSDAQRGGLRCRPRHGQPPSDWYRLANGPAEAGPLTRDESPYRRALADAAASGRGRPSDRRIAARSLTSSASGLWKSMVLVAAIHSGDAVRAYMIGIRL